MKFIDKLLSLIFFGLALLFFSINSILIIVGFVGTIIHSIENSTFDFFGFAGSLLALAACVLIILVSVFSGLDILRGEKLRGLKLFKRIVMVPLIFAGVCVVTSTLDLTSAIINNYDGRIIASDIIDIVLYAVATVAGVLAFLATGVDQTKKIIAMVSFGACVLASFIGFFFGFGFMGVVLFSLFGLGIAIMIINQFEEAK